MIDESSRCKQCYAAKREHVETKCLWGPGIFEPLFCGAEPCRSGGSHDPPPISIVHYVITSRKTGLCYHAICVPDYLRRGDVIVIR